MAANAANTDIFGKPQFNFARPITADQIQLLWSQLGASSITPGGGVAVAQANNFQVNYQQNVQRRYTLNSAQNLATIYPGRPQGTITIGRLVIDQALVGTGNDLLGGNFGGFNVCQAPAIIQWSNVGTSTYASGGTSAACNTTMGSYYARGCWVTNYSFQADADSLVVLDGVTIEFLQLQYVQSNTGITGDTFAPPALV